jgi:phage shock protein PspC (stress-responsive transcriptional regulator)
MNKVSNINLGGYPFTIDEDAYQFLSQYLETLNRHFQHAEGCEEIISDIETRLAELFREQAGTRVIITKQDVKNAVSVMGTPEDFGIDGSATETKKTTNDSKPKYINTGRRLFRDYEDRKIAGVCAGIAAFFGIQDPIWVRLGFVLFVFAGGSGIFAYFLLWLIVPKAKSTADRLAMRGEPMNIENIARAVEEGAETFSKRVHEFGSTSGQAKSFQNNISMYARRFGSFVAEVVRGVFRLIHPIKILIGILFLGAVVIGWTALVVGLSFIFPFFDYISPSNASFWGSLVSANAICMLGIPLLSLIFWLRRIFYGKAITPALSWTLGILFTLNVTAFFAMMPVFLKQFSQESEIKETLLIPKNQNNILNLDLKINKNLESKIQMGHIHISDEHLYVRDVNIRVEKSEDGQFEIIKKRNSQGANRADATKLVSEFDAPMSLSNDVLSLTTGFLIPKGNKYRGQNVEYLLRMPVGQKIKIKEAQRHDSNNDFWTQDFDDYFENNEQEKLTYTTWVMTEKGIEFDGKKKIKKTEQE